MTLFKPMLFVVGTALIANVANGADVVFQSDRNGIVDALIATPIQTKGLRSLTRQTPPIEVMRRKALGPQTRGFEPAAREPAARANLKLEFDYDSAQVRKDYEPLLEELADALADQQLRDKRFVINGHADASGSAEYNLVLSYGRARAVRDYLVNKLGVDKSRLDIAGFGEAVPLVANDTPANRQINRRVEVERLE